MKKIYINPGHSNTDPGAVGYETERKLNEAVSNHMNKYLLENYKCETRMNPGTMDSLSAICNDANSWGADLFVSNHFNAGRGDGYEALVYNQNRVSLGRIFEKHAMAVGQNSRGVKLRPNLTVLAKTNMPAVLNEGAFVDNLKDIQDWNDDTELKELGISYAKAAAEFLGLEEKIRMMDKPTEEYTIKQFVKDVQKACGATADGIAGPETLSKTVTISAYKNRSHAAVRCVQKYLSALGYTEVGEADGVAGAKFTSALAHFQQDNDCFVDGEAAEWSKTWHKLLGVS